MTARQMMPSTWRRPGRRFAILFLVLAGGTVGILHWLESFLVYPARRYPVGSWQREWEYEEADFSAADGTPLHGWLLRHPKPRYWILYFHGNGVHVADVGDFMNELRTELQATVFAFDYRGYGRSQGRPHEAGLLQDAEAALAFFADKIGRPPGDMVYFGRSIGGAVAIHLAAKAPPAALVLERTFARMTDVGARLLPFLPVRWLMRNRYPSIERIRHYQGPVLQSHGTADELVPLEQAKALFAAIPHPRKRLVLLPGCDHNGPNTREYGQALREFLATYAARPVDSE